jgi:hypothetical protein
VDLKQNLPRFITFTGAGDDTPIADMWALSSKYPIEWGILVSPERSGRDKRYPGIGFIDSLDYRLIPLSMHICGGFAEQLLREGSLTNLIRQWIDEKFVRVQVNIGAARWRDGTVQTGNLVRLLKWISSLNATPILQCRDGTEFPSSTLNMPQWLFDASGGRGIAPASWPSEPTTRLVGYAGGLGPANVAQAVAAIGTQCTNYWIDMESGVRDADDNFDLDKCCQVCEAVYGW